MRPNDQSIFSVSYASLYWPSLKPSNPFFHWCDFEMPILILFFQQKVKGHRLPQHLVQVPICYWLSLHSHICVCFSVLRYCLCVSDCLCLSSWIDFVRFFCQAGMRSAAPGLPTRLMITATCLLLCPRESGSTLARIAWIRVEISSASLSRLNKVSSMVSIQLLNRFLRCSRSTYAHVDPQLESSRFLRVFLCGWERMTPSPREAGHGRTALHSAI